MVVIIHQCFTYEDKKYKLYIKLLVATIFYHGITVHFLLEGSAL